MSPQNCNNKGIYTFFDIRIQSKEKVISENVILPTDFKDATLELQSQVRDYWIYKNKKLQAISNQNKHNDFLNIS